MDQIRAVLSAPLTRLFDLGDPFNIYFLTGAALTAACVYIARRPSRPLRRLRALIRAAFAGKIWTHRSSVVDYKLFLFASLFYASGIGGFFGTSEAVNAGVRSLLGAVFGPPQAGDGASVMTTAILAVMLVLFYDLGYWFAHWLMHRVPLLWEFHKVHHSAEVLTPMTEYRQHPVELLWFPVFAGMGTGFVYALADYLFGKGAQPLSLVWVNSLMFAFIATFLHLRHTQLWIPARGWFGRIVQSPAHHQIHHSTDPKHFDKNLGFCLSVWDWAFGTLYVPDEREELEFGLGAESHEHDGLFSTLWLPVRKSGEQIARQMTPKGADGVPVASADRGQA